LRLRDRDLPGTAALPVALMQSFLMGGNDMRFRKISRTGHDPRQIDLLAVLALLVIIIAAWRYLDDSTALPPSTTAYIVPSQSVHW
jgi:hypothetical protein